MKNFFILRSAPLRARHEGSALLISVSDDENAAKVAKRAPL
jgi:hypothetical protein